MELSPARPMTMMTPNGIAYLVLVLVLIYLAVAFLSFAIGAPFVPTPHRQVATMIELAVPRQGETWVDLGSGDGRVVIAAARAGARAIGYEFDPFLVLWSRLAILFRGLRGKAEIRWGNLWRADVGGADVVSTYLMPYYMLKLQRKLEREMKPGSRVVVYSFGMPDWFPIARRGFVYLYAPKSPSAQGSGGEAPKGRGGVPADPA